MESTVNFVSTLHPVFNQVASGTTYHDINFAPYLKQKKQTTSGNNLSCYKKQVRNNKIFPSNLSEKQANILLLRPYLVRI